MLKVLKVRAAGTGMVPDYEAQANGLRRFVGWKFDATIGEPKPDQNPDGSWSDLGNKHGGFVQIDAPVDVPERKEYLDALRDGHLEAADEETFKSAALHAGAHGVKLSPPKPPQASAQDLKTVPVDPKAVKAAVDAMKGA